MPQLAVFPKAFMQELCKDGTMKVSEWIDMAVELQVDVLEWYSGFLGNKWSVMEKQYLCFAVPRILRIPMSIFGTMKLKNK